jgi:hypothetical protein
MTILNRGQIVVYPTKTFETWAISHSEDELFFSETPEPTVYLIEEEFWDDDLVIEKYRKKIIQRECSDICSDQTKWPIIKDNEQFQHYFTVHLGIMVFDLLESDLSCEEMDL